MMIATEVKGIESVLTAIPAGMMWTETRDVLDAGAVGAEAPVGNATGRS
jgi:hypothetical protein